MNWIRITPQGGNKANLSADSETVIYPNPFTDQLSFKTDGSEISLRIFDLRGREMMSSTGIESGESIDVSTLSGGIYMIQIYKNGIQEKVQRIVKQ